MRQFSQRMLGATGDRVRALWSSRCLALPALAQQPKPNILFILADNIGYGDIGVYGGGELRGAPTPRIDRLAAEGLRLTQFLVEPACTPSRAALMTGRYSIRSGLSLVAVEGTAISLPATEITMAEMLRDAGYATAIFGKWHLGAQPYSQPQNKGFDEFYGIPPAVTWDAFLMIPSGPADQDARHPARQGAADRRGQAGRAAEGGEALHRGGAARDRLGAGRPRHRFHEAPEGGRQAVLPLSADLPDALSEPAVEAFRGRIAHRPVRRFADGRRCHRRPDARCARRARPRARHHRRLRLRQWSRRTRSARVRRRHAGHGVVRTLSRRARRRQRRLDPHRRHDPLAGPDPAAIILRDVLDHGFLPDLRAACGRQGAGRPPDRRRRPERPAARRERRRAARPSADLRRSRSGRRALEAVPRLFRRRGAGPQRLGRRDTSWAALAPAPRR